MAEIVNLRTARKRRDRAERERVAGENRALHGRTRSERVIEAARRDTEARQLDGHRREPGPGDE
ncbi:MAG: DUF4169 family protein [Rhizobiaceae bacterium]